jgi:hypothetical protein
VSARKQHEKKNSDGGKQKKGQEIKEVELRENHVPVPVLVGEI